MQGHCPPCLHMFQVRVLSTFQGIRPVVGMTFVFSLGDTQALTVPGPEIAYYTHGHELWQSQEEGAHFTEEEMEAFFLPEEEKEAGG